MSAFNNGNVYTNEHAFRSFIAALVAFILWWLARLISGLFGGLLAGRRNTVPSTNDSRFVDHGATTTAVVPKSRWHGKSERVSEALRDIFISLAAVTFLNYLANGVSKGFEVLAWIVLVLGVVWALGRGLVKRFADGLLILIIPLFIAMWAIALRSVHYASRVL